MKTTKTTNISPITDTDHDDYLENFTPPYCPYCNSTEIDEDTYCNTCGCYTDEIVLDCETGTI